MEGVEAPSDTAIRDRAASPGGLVLVSVLLPDADGKLGGGAWRSAVDGDPLDDERLALGLTDHDRAVPPLDHRDAVRAAYRAAGVRPADHADWLARTSPQLAYDFMLQAAEWRRRDVLRGVEAPSLSSRYDDERVLAAAIVAHATTDSIEARAARFVLLQAAVADLPEPDRPEHLWRSLLRMIGSAEADNFAWSMVRRNLSELPSVEPAGHDVLADMADRRGGLLAAQISDLALRAALRDGDVARVGFWWRRLRQARPLPRGVSTLHAERLADNERDLSGAVLARIGAASRWDDGLRRAAVVCLPHAHPLDVHLVGTGDGWESPTKPDGYLACTLSEASPPPPAGQRARLLVRQAGSPVPSAPG